MDALPVHIDDAQVQQLVSAISSAHGFGHVIDMFQRLYDLIGVESAKIIQEIREMSASLHDQVMASIAEAHHNSDVTASVLKAFQDFMAIVDANKTDAVALEAALNEYRANDQALADAVANVPTPAPTP